ncbi:hypothetical protein [Streptomyces uncialis]|uniref:Uncharacterized protein n=1 Tax=Streptomyces uncialis TaxID=1048205 RepID=A0A1Q4V6W1_9ACTN|nr:hypothetical protein [Streptomyces uncialis]OKH93544.1 hypothetical protein AB852_18995 [Streptomyces uncialis]
MPTCLAIGTTATVVPPSRRPVPDEPGRPVPDERQRSTTFYDDVVRPTCEELGVTFVQADQLTDAGLPADQLLRLVSEVDIVVVSLSGADEELSFALGVRHALGRRTIHLTEGAVALPGAGWTPRIEIPPHSTAPDTARQQLTELLTDALREVPCVALPVGAVVPAVADPVGEPDDDAPGLFDLVAESEAQLAAITGEMADVESAMEDLKAMMELMAEDMVRAGRPGAPTSAMLAVINRMAKAIEGPAHDLESAAERFAERMRIGAIGFTACLEWAGNTPRDEWPDSMPGLLDQLTGTSFELRSDAVGFQEVIALIDMFGASSRNLRGPARRIGTALRTLFRSFTVLEEWQGMAVALKQA